MQKKPEICVQSLGREDPLEEGTATPSGILAWRETPMDRGAWQATVCGVTKSLIAIGYAVEHREYSHYLVITFFRLIMCFFWL